MRGKGTGAVAVVAPVALVCVPWALRSTGAFDWLLSEDGVFEYAQAAACALAAWWFVVAARRGGRSLESTAWLGAAALMIFVVGEEMAWGTRLLHHGVAAIENVNDQGDTTLHNIGAGLELSFAGISAVSTAAIGWLVARRREHVTLATWFALPALYGLSRLLIHADHDFAKWSEAFELAFALGAAQFAWLEAVSGLAEPVDGVSRHAVGIEFASD